MSVVAAVIVSAVLSTALLWAVSKWSGSRIPLVDLVLIATLCAALAPLPRVGWVLATLIMSLLLTRATDADPWPDVVLMVIGSNVVWLMTNLLVR